MVWPPGRPSLLAGIVDDADGGDRPPGNDGVSRLQREDALQRQASADAAGFDEHHQHVRCANKRRGLCGSGEGSRCARRRAHRRDVSRLRSRKPHACPSRPHEHADQHVPLDDPALGDLQSLRGLHLPRPEGLPRQQRHARKRGEGHPARLRGAQPATRRHGGLARQTEGAADSLRAHPAALQSLLWSSRGQSREHEHGIQRNGRADEQARRGRTREIWHLQPLTACEARFVAGWAVPLPNRLAAQQPRSVAFGRADRV